MAADAAPFSGVLARRHLCGCVMTDDGFASSVRRVAVLGDIGGQLGVFQRVMADLGTDSRSGQLPGDLAVVQVGDLIRVGGRGLDNAGCVAAAARYWAANPGRWVQLVGNHDMALLGGPRRPNWPGPEVDDDVAAATLRRWWEERRVRLAVAIRCLELGDVLITHAGLTRGRWRRLGAPPDPHSAAALLNAKIGEPISEVIHGGALTGVDAGPDGECVDVTWAEVLDELYGPWLAAGRAPFTQVHGHAAPWNWTIATWWPEATPAVRAATTIDPAARRTSTRLGPGEGSPLAISVDWMLGDEPTTDTWPLLSLTLRPNSGADSPGFETTPSA